MNETPSSVRDGRMFISGHLSENLHYTTHIKAINSVGSSTSSPIELCKSARVRVQSLIAPLVGIFDYFKV